MLLVLLLLHLLQLPCCLVPQKERRCGELDVIIIDLLIIVLHMFILPLLYRVF